MAKGSSPTKRKPWERLPNETPKAYDAFLTYLELGPTQRSFRLTTKVSTGKDVISGSIQHWSQEYNWTKRAAAWDDYCFKVWLEKHQDEIVKARLKAAERIPDTLEDIYKIIKDKKATKTQLDAAIFALGLVGVDKLQTDNQQGTGQGQVHLYIPDNGRGGGSGKDKP